MFAGCNSFNKSTNEYQPSDRTQKFIQQISSVMACIHTHKGGSGNSSVCSDCEKEYCDLNDLYNELKDLEDDAVCMDIVDSVSISSYRNCPLCRVESSRKNWVSPLLSL